MTCSQVSTVLTPETLYLWLHHASVFGGQVVLNSCALRVLRRVGTQPKRLSTAPSANYLSPSDRSPQPTCRPVTSPCCATRPDACATRARTKRCPASSGAPAPGPRVARSPCGRPHRSTLPSRERRK